MSKTDVSESINGFAVPLAYNADHKTTTPLIQSAFPEYDVNSEDPYTKKFSNDLLAEFAHRHTDEAANDKQAIISQLRLELERGECSNKMLQAVFHGYKVHEDREASLRPSRFQKVYRGRGLLSATLFDGGYDGKITTGAGEWAKERGGAIKDRLGKIFGNRNEHWGQDILDERHGKSIEVRRGRPIS